MTCVGSLRQLTVGVRGSACKTSPLCMPRETNDCAVVKLSKGEVCETGKQLIKIHVFVCFMGPPTMLSLLLVPFRKLCRTAVH